MEKQKSNFILIISLLLVAGFLATSLISFFVSDQTRIYYHADGILKKVSPTEKRDRWYCRVKNIPTPYELDIDPDMANKDAMTIFVNHRGLDYKGNYIGTTGVGLTVSAVKTLIEKYQQKYGRQIYLINRRGDVMLAGTNFPKTIGNVFKDERFTSFAETITTHTESSFSYHNGSETIHTNARLIPKFNWYLIVEQSEKKIKKPDGATQIPFYPCV